MPAITVKGTMFFNDGAETGWTETVYFAADGLAAGLTALTGNFFGARKGILHPDYRLTEIRVSDDSDLVKGDSLVFVPTLAQSKGTFPVVTGQTADKPYVALKCRAEAGASHRRAYHLRGLPLNVVDPNGTYNPAADWITPFNYFRSLFLIAAQPVQIRTVSYSNPATPVSILSILGGGRQISFTVPNATAANFGVGKTVKIKLAYGTQNLNGIWKVLAQQVNAIVNTNTDILLKPKPNTVVTGALQNLMFVQVATVNTVSCTSLIPEAGVKVNTGRPSGEPVGRRKRRAA